MKSKEDIKVAIADGSVIMRSGLASVLKHFSEFNFRINEITNQEALTIFLRLHTPDLLIINPLFAIGMNLTTIRKTYPSLKIAALTSSLIDNQLLSDYDTTISINDDIEWVLMAYNGGPTYANNLYNEGAISKYAIDILEKADELRESSR